MIGPVVCLGCDRLESTVRMPPPQPISPRPCAACGHMTAPGEAVEATEHQINAMVTAREDRERADTWNLWTESEKQAYYARYGNAVTRHCVTRLAVGRIRWQETRPEGGR